MTAGRFTMRPGRRGPEAPTICRENRGSGILDYEAGLI